MNKIHILGIGPGSREYLLPITERIVKDADILIGGRRALALFNDYDKLKVPITADLKRVRDYIRKNYRKKKIAVLLSGDPGLYSMLNYLKKYFPEEDLEVIPGISAMQLAFARAKMVWQDARIISLHGNDDKERLLELVREREKVALFTDHKFPPQAVASYLLENGIKGKKGIICENLSYPSERITGGDLYRLSQNEFAPLAVMVIYDG